MFICVVRFRLYVVRKMIRERMMGEKLFYFSYLYLEGEMKMILVLELRSNISVSMWSVVVNDLVCLRFWNC